MSRNRTKRRQLVQAFLWFFYRFIFAHWGYYILIESIQFWIKVEQRFFHPWLIGRSRCNVAKISSVTILPLVLRKFPPKDYLWSNQPLHQLSKSAWRLRNIHGHVSKSRDDRRTFPYYKECRSLILVVLALILQNEWLKKYLQNFDNTKKLDHNIDRLMLQQRSKGNNEICAMLSREVPLTIRTINYIEECSTTLTNNHDKTWRKRNNIRKNAIWRQSKMWGRNWGGSLSQELIYYCIKRQLIIKI